MRSWVLGDVLNIQKWRNFARYTTLFLSSFMLVVFFENCGVEQPRVEVSTYAMSSLSPESHQNLASGSKCSQCHEASRPTLKTLAHDFDHKDPKWAAQDCATCHTQKQTWGVTWGGGQFAHDPHPATCLECHNNQMPKSQILVANDPLRPYVHTAGVECSTCHNTTSKFDSISDFRPALYQPSGLIGSKSFSTAVITATFNGATMIRSAPAARNFKLEVEHGQDQVGNLTCVTCHGATAATSGSYKGALFHQNITVNPTACAECHQNARPNGVVGAKGFMRHEAVNWTSNAIGAVNRGTAAIVGSECATCHLNAPSMPQAGQPPVAGSKPFSGASFHLNTPDTSLSSCLDCHAHSRPTGSANFTDVIWRNKTNVGAPPFTTFDLARHAPNVDCATCHKAPGVANTIAANWAPGYFLHASANINCLNCHTAGGVTSTNHSTYLSNCISCHLGSTARFPNPVIADWKVNVSGGVPTGVTGFRNTLNSVTCTPVLGSAPNCVPSNPNLIPNGYDHAINSNMVSCQNCHGPNAASSLNGKFHSAPTGVANWIAPAPADVATCNRCHDPAIIPQTVVSVRNVGIIGSQINVNNGPTPFAGVNHGHILVAGQQCIQCHTAPTNTVAGNFNIATKIHTKFTPAQITTCSECHNKRMPTAALPRRNQVVTKGTNVPQLFTHANVNSIPSIALQQCSTCHTNDGVSWTTAGRVSYHNKVTVSRNCNLCHIAPGGLVTSSTTGVSFNHSLVANIGDCVSCHAASVPRVNARIPTATDWDGGTAAPATYTIPSHVTRGITIPGYTGIHSTNTNCVSCHGTGNYKVITDFDHQGLPAGENSCVSCHLGAKTDVAAFIASTSGISMKTAGDRHHPTNIFNGKATSCVGCHTQTRGANTFNNNNGIIFPAAARQAYVSVGCGSVNGTTFSCHEDGQRTMTVPVTTGTSGRWK